MHPVWADVGRNRNAVLDWHRQNRTVLCEAADSRRIHRGSYGSTLVLAHAKQLTIYVLRLVVHENRDRKLFRFFYGCTRHIIFLREYS